MPESKFSDLAIRDFLEGFYTNEAECHNVETIMSNLNMIVNGDGLTVREALSSVLAAVREEHKSTDEDVRVYLKQILFSVRTGALHCEHLNRIENGEYTIQYVGSGESTPAFAYTIGLSLRDDHPEYIAIGNLSPGCFGAAFKELEELNGPSEGLVQIKELTIDDEPITVKLVSVNVDSVIERYARELGNPRWLKQKPGKIVQIVFPDAKGRLPDDELYDKTFVQPILD